MIHGLVAGRALHRADQRIGRIQAERDFGGLIASTQVLRHGFAHDGRQRLSPTFRPVLQLAIGVFRKAEIGRDEARHRSTTIPRYQRIARTVSRFFQDKGRIGRRRPPGGPPDGEKSRRGNRDGRRRQDPRLRGLDAVKLTLQQAP